MLLDEVLRMAYVEALPGVPKSRILPLGVRSFGMLELQAWESTHGKSAIEMWMIHCTDQNFFVVRAKNGESKETLLPASPKPGCP